MKRYELMQEKEMALNQLYPFEVDGQRVLLVKTEEGAHAVANHCGHMGVPLEDGTITPDGLRCSAHGIAFDLVSGEVSNRPWESCDAITTYPVFIENGVVGIKLEQGGLERLHNR